MFKTVSQTQIRYPHSQLSEGHLGGITGGDRLPWITFNSSDNYASLITRQWQIHLFVVTEDVKRLATNVAVEVITLPWKDSFQRKGFRENGVYVVRPDGYVGLAALNTDVVVIERYLTTWLTRPHGSDDSQ